jgi:hypothetical protein
LDDEIKDDEILRHVTHVGGMRNAYKLWSVKQEGKRPLGRFRHIDIRLPNQDMDRIHFVLNTQALQGSCEYGTDPLGYIEYREFLEYYQQKEPMP